EFRAGLNGNMHNEGLVHWQWLDQGNRDGIIYLHNRTRSSGIDIATALHITSTLTPEAGSEDWDVDNAPTRMVRFEAVPGQSVGIEKRVAVFTSRDVSSAEVVNAAVNKAHDGESWDVALEANKQAWE